MRRDYREGFMSSAPLPTERCSNPSRFSFFYLVLFASPGLVETDGRDLNARKESIFAEQDRTSSIMCHVEAIRQEMVFEVFNCFPEGDDEPFSRNMPFDSSFLSTSRSRVPIIDGEPSLFCQSVGHVVVKTVFLRMAHVFWLVPRGKRDRNLSHRRRDA